MKEHPFNYLNAKKIDEACLNFTQETGKQFTPCLFLSKNPSITNPGVFLFDTNLAMFHLYPPIPHPSSDAAPFPLPHPKFCLPALLATLVLWNVNCLPLCFSGLSPLLSVQDFKCRIGLYDNFPPPTTVEIIPLPPFLYIILSQTKKKKKKKK